MFVSEKIDFFFIVCTFMASIFHQVVVNSAVTPLLHKIFYAEHICHATALRISRSLQGTILPSFWQKLKYCHHPVCPIPKGNVKGDAG